MLRRLSLVLVLSGAVVSLASTAQAAPRKPVFKAPPPVPAASGISFYGGVHGGYGWSRFSSSVAIGTVDSVSPEGAIGGGQLGFNYQIDKLVLGAEGDFSLASVQKSASGTILGVPMSASVRHLWFGTLAGRVGYAFGRTLPYVKGGVAWTRYKIDVDAPSIGGASGSENRTGWMIGAGVEQAVTDQVSVKLEYNYIDFGTIDRTALTNDGLTVTPIDIKLTTQLVKLGVNYRFSGF